jgi:hypothetical protein
MQGRQRDCGVAGCYAREGNSLGEVIAGFDRHFTLSIVGLGWLLRTDGYLVLVSWMSGWRR